MINLKENYFIDFTILATLKKVFKKRTKIKKKITLRQVKNIMMQRKLSLQVDRKSLEIVVA